MLDDSLSRFLPPMPPPPFASIDAMVRDALPTLQPYVRIDVPTWAEQNRLLSQSGNAGKWRNDFAPYMVEPARMITSRKYRAGVFVGPARTAKTESIILNPIGHAIDCQPQDVLVVCQTQDSAKSFSNRKLRPMLRTCESLSKKQGRGRGSDNLYEKAFIGGTNLYIGWPVIGYFSQNEFRTVLLTDYDRFPEDIDGEGSGFSLAVKRVQAAGSLGMVICESSPNPDRYVVVDDWKAGGIHEHPPVRGILAEFNKGTRGLYYWICPSCGDPFFPSFDKLIYERKGSPSDMASNVEILCPAGCCIAYDKKAEMNRKGIWLHENSDGTDKVEIDDPDVRQSDIVSWRCEGPIAAMQNWRELVLKYEQAKSEFDLTGNELPLKTTVTLDQGCSYKPQIKTLGDSLSLEALKKSLIRSPLEIAPADTRFITVAIDVQGNRFVVQVDAWRTGLARQLIDRFDLAVPPQDAPNSAKRTMDPGRYFEDWMALFELLEKSYPVANTGYSLLPRAQIIDLRGAAGVTQNAYRYFRLAKKRGQAHQVFLANNQGGLKGDRAFISIPEKVQGEKLKNKKTDLRLVRIRTDILKDEVALTLTREDDGPGAYRIPDSLPDNILAEFCAEHRTEKGWQIIKAGSRNEALDLAVYNKGLVIVLGAERIDWARPPQWADRVENNNYGLAPAGEIEIQASVPSSPAKRSRRVRSKGI